VAGSAAHACNRLGATTWAGHGGAAAERALGLGGRPFSAASVGPSFGRRLKVPNLETRRGAPVTAGGGGGGGESPEQETNNRVTGSFLFFRFVKLTGTVRAHTGVM